VQASNVIIFCFADPTVKTINSGYLSSMQAIINNEATGTINLLSIGGQHVFTINDPASAITNIATQIAAYNSQLTGGKISGVDLDLENGIPADTINALAQGFKSAGLVVSAAPQVYNSNGAGGNVDSSNPTNLVLTSGGTSSTYTPAIASGYVDYLFAQTYNTGGWTIDGVSETSVDFFKAAARALNNCVKSDCSAYQSSTASAAIPVGTQVVVGEPANGGASGTANNIFASNGTTSYDQDTILNTLKTSINDLNADPNYPYFDGAMMWSLNNDYFPGGGMTTTPPSAGSVRLSTGPLSPPRCISSCR